MTKRLILTLWCAGVVTTAQAQSVAHVPAAFLDVGLDAQSMGLAGARIALVRDVSAILWNPAALLSVRQQQVLLSTTRQFGLVPYHALCYARPAFGRTIAVAAITAGDDVLRENTLILGTVHRVRGLLAVGASLKFYQASFGNNASGRWDYQNANRQVQGTALGFGLDVGVRGMLRGRLVWALTWSNLLSNVRWDANNQAGTAKGGSESVPSRLRAGLGIMPSRRTLLEVDLEKSLHLDVRDRIYAGVEQVLFNLLTLRGGYARNLDASVPNRVVAVGGGIAVTLPRTDVDVGLDVAYLFTELQNFPHVSLRIGW